MMCGIFLDFVGFLPYWIIFFKKNEEVVSFVLRFKLSSNWAKGFYALV
jgi:hypothetical protein